MPGVIGSIPKFQFSANGVPMVGGTLTVYVAGTTTLIGTWQDSALSIANTNPIVLDARGECVLWLDSAVVYKFLLKNAQGVAQWTQDNISNPAALANALRSDLAAANGVSLIGGAGQVVASIGALRALLKTSASKNAIATGYFAPGDGGGGVYWLDAADSTTAENGGTVIVATDGGRWKLARSSAYDIAQFGAKVDGVTDDTAKIVAAYAAVSGPGGLVLLKEGAGVAVSASINCTNWVTLIGRSKRASRVKALAGHTGPYMMTVVNGTGSMFDNSLRDLTLNCNDVAGLGGVISDAWQEGGGLRDVLIQNFCTYGVRFRNGYGGAALCEISQSEIFGSSTAAPTAGIQVDQISAIGSFMLKVRDTTIAGATALTALPLGINMVNDSLHAQNVHFENCTSGIQVQGAGHHVLIGVTGGPGVTNVVEISSNFTGTLRMLGCHRAGATNLLRDNRAGGYGVVPSVDTDFVINPQPTFGPGITNSCGVFDGTAATPGVAACFGVASVARASVGDYTVTETWSRNTANAAVWATSNLAIGRITIDLINSTQFRVRIYNASNLLADSNEVKFGCVRVK